MRLGHLLAGSLRPRSGYGRHRAFRDPAVQHGLARHGYHVTPKVLDDEVIERLCGAAARWRALRTDAEDGAFFSSFSRRADEAATYARAQVRDVLLPALEPLLDPGGARLRPSVFQLKPPSPTSHVQAHQDCFLVDERRSFGVFAWVALTDVGLDDGPLYVVPGSHRYGTWNRISSTTDQFAGLHDVIHRHARALPVSAGQVLLFDNAVIHGSIANRSGADRLAVSAVVTPCDTDITIPAAVDGPRPASTPVYRHQHDDLVGADWPDISSGEPLGEARLPRLAVGPRGFAAVCRLDALLRPGAPGVPLPI